MPMTPLHLGLLAPINHFFPNKVSNLSFILVNLLLDTSAIAYYAFGLEMGEFHGPDTHSFIAAFALGSVVAIGGFAIFVINSFFDYSFKNENEALAWVLGAFLGAFTHILLDAMVHSEMRPFAPIPGNPFYWDGMFWLSLILVLPLVWLTIQYVSCVVRHVQVRLAVWKLRNLEP